MTSIGEIRDRLNAAAPALAAPRRSSGAASAIDPLAAAIAAIAQHYGMAISPVALLSGLPLVAGRLPVEHMDAAARRAGLEKRVSRNSLRDLSDAELPAVVVFATLEPAVVWSIDRGPDGRPVAAVVSGGGARRREDFAALSSAAERVLLLRPVSTRDERGDEAVSSRGRSWFLPAFRMSRKIYAEAILATAAINLLALAMPLFTMNVYDRVLPNAVEETLWALAIGVALATLFDFAIKTLRGRFVDAASRRADVTLANFIYSRVLGARLPDRPVSAGVRANAMREFETIREFFTSATLAAFGDLPFLVLFLVMIFVVAGSLGLVALAAIPIVLGIAWLTQRALARHCENSFKETAQKNAVVVETMVGLESLKAAGAESWAATRWETAVAEHVRTGLAMRNLSGLGLNALFCAQTLSQVAMIVVGFYMVKAGALTTGALIAATMLAGRAMQPLGQVAGLLARLHQTRIAYRTLSDIVEAPQERPDGARLISKAEFDGRITFEHVTFGYDKDSVPALLDVSFDIAPGERVGIVGAIGSGKTTILKLIHALYRPQQGHVLADGLPVAQIEPACLRAGVGLALQSAELFHGTIRSNVALSDPGAADADVIAAVRSAGALEWIARCAKGLETPVRERGAGLSGGQAQSVTLARALFRRPRVLLLDEPTSNMDARSEADAVSGLREFARGRTLIVVSHRPALLGLVDRLVVLEGGRKVFDGPKAEVMKHLEAVTAERAKAKAKTAEAGS